MYLWQSPKSSQQNVFQKKDGLVKKQPENCLLFNTFI